MWFLLSIATAVLAGTSDAISKHLLSKNAVREVAFSKAFWASLFLIPFLLYSSVPSDPKSFWISVGIAIPLEIVASLLFQKALQLSPLSITIPFMAFTPVFLLVLGWMFLGENVAPGGICGILLVSCGAFFLTGEFTASQLKMGIDKFNNQKGPLFMILVSFIYSITSVLAKKALLASSPFFFCGTYYILIATGLFFLLKNPKKTFRSIAVPQRFFIGVGACEAAAFLFQFFAFQQAETAYVIAVKRMSLLLALLYGFVFFREEARLHKIIGAMMMITGAVLIALAG